jgi:hypothetical protein
MFTHQAAFWNGPSTNMTATQVSSLFTLNRFLYFDFSFLTSININTFFYQVISAIADLAVPLGISKRDFINGMNDPNLDNIARISWKVTTKQQLTDNTNPSNNNKKNMITKSVSLFLCSFLQDVAFQALQVSS